MDKLSQSVRTSSAVRTLVTSSPAVIEARKYVVVPIFRRCTAIVVIRIPPIVTDKISVKTEKKYSCNE
jgi:hypothetical protein